MAALSRGNTSLPQKLGLSAFGFFLAILFLECVLRLGGCIILSLQNHRNALAMRQKGVCRIMCIGESTTQSQYPAFLERSLNGRNLGIRFSVIDRGLVGAYSSVLVDRMEADLETYHPDMVVAMMGINDGGPHMPDEPETGSWVVRLLRSLRTYKLARIAGLHIVSLAHPAGIFPPGAGAQRRERKEALDRGPGNARDEGGMVESYRYEGKFAEAEAAARKALRIDPRNDRAYVYLGWTYIMQGKKMPKRPQARSKFAAATAAFKRALELNPKNDEAYRGLGSDYEVQGEYAAAVQACKKALGLNPGSDEAHEELGRIYGYQGKFAAAAAAFKKALEINPSNDRAFIQLDSILSGGPIQSRRMLEKSILRGLAKRCAMAPQKATDRACGLLSAYYVAMGDAELAERYNDKAEQSRLREYNLILANNYRRLKAVLDQRGVKLVCVQYPIRRLEPLRVIFQGRGDGIVFVDNENAFKDAVKKGSLKEYFVDLFAGDFGHCTDKGNQLLADNIAAALAREVFGK